MGELWELWTRWLDGQQLTGATLWGQPLYIWGRLGKALQFLAGLTVVLDLIGPEPLRAFGRRMNKIPRVDFLKEQAKKPLNITANQFVLVILASLLIATWPLTQYTRSEIWRFLWTSHLWIALVVICAGITVWAALYLFDDVEVDSLPDKLIPALFAGVALTPVAVVSVPLVLAMAIMWVVTVYGVLLPVSFTLAFLLDRARPAHPARWAAVLLFLAGFHLDFLSS
ncbi:hypothetical protein [Nonomuraea sp. NPDC049141]|uniref:hypothetical protein n=1 Tax=unclassified Nonomuraea TaxID=2593643 RepID=UPI0033C7B7FF